MSSSIERILVDGPTRDALAPLGLPMPVADDWARFAAPQVRSLLVARDAAGGVAGAAITSGRPLASYLKIGGIWAPDPAVFRALAVAAEELAWDSGFVVVKREIRAREPGAGYFGPSAGYVPVPAPEVAAPIPDPCSPVPSAWFKWRAPSSVSPAVSPADREPVPYMRQTTDFTCGTASLSMLLARAGVIAAPTRDVELALWRQATTIVACDPYGLAVTASRHGLRPRVVTNAVATLFTEDLTSPQERQLRDFIQDGFRDEAARAGIETGPRAYDVSELRSVIAAGGAAIVLVDTLLVTGDKCPHWIVVHGLTGDHFLAHDPWTEWAQGESWVDAYDVPLTADALDRIAVTGEPAVRAMLAFPAIR